MCTISMKDMLEGLDDFLTTPANGSRVIMLCGIAGSGKSTLAQGIVQQHPSFHRLSVDQIIYETRGIYGVDYPPSEYQELQNKAMDKLEEQFVQLLRQKKDIVLDRSFWAREDREACYEVLKLEGAGCHKLVYLRAGKHFVWERIQVRSKKTKTADSALDISEALFDRYWSGFEAPGVEENPYILDVDLADHRDDNMLADTSAAKQEIS